MRFGNSECAPRGFIGRLSAAGSIFENRAALLEDLMKDYPPVPPAPKGRVSEGVGYVSPWFDWGEVDRNKQRRRFYSRGYYS